MNLRKQYEFWLRGSNLDTQKGVGATIDSGHLLFARCEKQYPLPAKSPIVIAHQVCGRLSALSTEAEDLGWFASAHALDRAYQSLRNRLDTWTVAPQ